MMSKILKLVNKTAHMQIIFCVTNDIVTDQRVNRIARTLQKLPAEIVIAGIRKTTSLPLNENAFVYRRFKMIFKKGPLFYMEYNARLVFFLLFSKAGIFVANDLDTLPAVFLASVIKKCPVVYDSHEYFTELPELVTRRTVRNIWKRIEKLILPKIKYCYTVNESIAGTLNRHYGISMKVIRNVPLRINELPSYDPLKNNNEKLVIYQGALNMGRGLEMAIAAMEYVNNCTLIIAGSGYLENELKKLAVSVSLQNKIVFLGMVRPDDLVKYTVQADLGISLEENTGLNYYFALPNKLFDYIQARIPVLVSDLPEMSSVVNKYKVGMTIQTNDPRVLAATINEMLYNSDLRKFWKKNLELAAEELCWEKEEPELIEIYTRVITDHAFLKADN